MVHRKVNIFCLYWVGEFRGRDFCIRDVERLYFSVKKHIDRDFTFYCLTNSNEGFPCYVKPIPLLYGWPGWWSKVELHRADLPEGRALYLDLDSHVMRSLKPILDFEGDLVMFPTPIPEHKWENLRRKNWVLKYQAATMLFTVGCRSMQMVWNRFLESPEKWMKKYRSEQDIMGDWIPNQPMFPREWMMKLGSIYRHNLKSIPSECIIVTGQPPHKEFRKTDKLDWFEPMAR